MRLTPYWWNSLAPNTSLDIPAADLPPRVDVVVVGAGFTGLAAALALLRQGRSVLVLDRGQPGLGASTRNGGICSGSIRVSHAAMAQAAGRNYADRVYAEAVEARDDLSRFIEEEKMDCQYHAPGFFTGAMSAADYDDQARAAEVLNTIPGHQIEMLPKAEMDRVIRSDRFYGGMLRHGIAAYHPARFFAGLRDKVMAEGGVICADTAVQQIAHDPEGKAVITDRGTVFAGKVIVATNGYNSPKEDFSRFIRRRIVPVQSAIIVTEKIGKDAVRELMPTLASFSTTAHLAAYFRPVPDGDRILLGARSFDRQEPSRRTVDFLKAKLASYFPQLDDLAGRKVEMEYAWLGNVAFSRSHLPTIFEEDGVYYCAGFAGSGTVWGRWLGRKTAEIAMGISNQPSVFFGAPPPSIPLYDGNPWFMPFFNTYYAARDLINERRHRP